MADDIRIGIAVVSDSAGTTKAQQDLAKVRREIEDLKKAFRTGALGSGEFSKQLADAEKRAKALDKALDAVGEKRRINLETGGLEDVSKASGAARLQTLGRDIRHLPSVRVPGLGIGTDTFGRGAEVAGRLGVSFEQLAAGMVVTTVAVGLMAVAFKEFSDEAKRQAAELTAVVDARRDVGQDIAGGLTTEDAKERLEEINRLREREQTLLDETSAALRDAQKETSAANLLGGDFETTAGSRFLSGLIPQVAALQTEVDTSTATVASLTAEETALNAALEDGTLAANDTRKAEEELAAARTQSILTEASQAGELASLKERAASLTQEQIDSELEALERRKIGAEAELASLEASGDTSEEVAKKIAQLRESIGFLGEQSDVLKTARKTARSSEADKAAEKAAKEREKAAEKQAKDAQKRLEDTAKAQQQYNDKLQDASQNFRDAIADINRSLKDDLTDNATQLQDDLSEASLEFNQEQLKEERAYQRDLAGIKRDSARAELEATRTRDFAALAAAREQANEAISQRQQSEADENAEQLTEFQQQRESLARERAIADRDARLDAQRAARDASVDRDRAYRDAATDRQRALRDINSMEQNFQRNSLNRWDDYFNQILQKQDRATGNTSRSTRQQTSNQMTSFDDVQFMFSG